MITLLLRLLLLLFKNLNIIFTLSYSVNGFWFKYSIKCIIIERYCSAYYNNCSLFLSLYAHSSAASSPLSAHLALYLALFLPILQPALSSPALFVPLESPVSLPYRCSRY